MSEFDEINENKFFIIDSNNINEIKTQFYGYMIQEDNIIFNSNIRDDILITGLGAYLWVKIEDEKIRIIQDFNGSYGLYLFEDDDYFAISNSYIKLAEHLKNSHKLTFNQDYANSFLFAGLCTLSPNQTLINEISLIPRNYEVIINKIDRSLKYDKLDLKDQSVDLDSKEGIEILDAWFERWVNVIRSLKLKTANVQFNLGGDLDSRAVSALWLSANLNLNKLSVKANANNKPNYEIAAGIAEKFGFKLNENRLIPGKYEFDDFHTPILFAFYTKLGFHKLINFPIEKFDEPMYMVSGRGAETIHGYYNKTPNEYIAEHVEKFKDKDTALSDSAKKLLDLSFRNLSDNYPYLDYDSMELTEQFYREVRCRNHYGKSFVEDHNRNIINISPFMDADLHKLRFLTAQCDDRNILLVLILARYFPELLEFGLHGGKSISTETIDYAKKINESYPFSKISFDYIEGANLKQSDVQSANKVNCAECNEYVKETFNSPKFEFEFNKYLPSKFYYMIYDEVNNQKPYLRNAYSAISILNAINYTKINSKDLESWFDDFTSPISIEDFKDLWVETEGIISDFENRIKLHDAEINYKDSQLDNMSSKLNLKDTQIKAMESKLSNNEDAIANLNLELEDANSKIDSLARNRDGDDSNYQLKQEALNDKIRVYDNQVNSLNENLRVKEINFNLKESDLNKKIKDMDLRLNNANNQINLLNDDIHNKEKSFKIKESRFNNKLEDMNARLEDANSQIDDAVRQLNDKDLSIRDKDNQIKLKEEELRAAESTFNVLKNEYDSQLSKLDSKEYCISCFKEEISNNNTEIEYLKRNNFTKSMLNPFAYLYLFIKSNPKELSLNLKLYKALKDSKCFDIGYYLNKNKDIQGSKWCKYFSPELHYVCNGFDEDRKFNKKYFNRNSKKELLEYILKCQ